MWGTRQDVPARRPAFAGHETGAPQSDHQLIEVRLGQPLPVGDVVGLDRTLAVMAGEVDQGTESVLGARRDLYRTITSASAILLSVIRNPLICGEAWSASDTMT